MNPWFRNPILVGKNGAGTAIHASAAYNPFLLVEGGRIVGNGTGIGPDGGARQVLLKGTTFQNATNLDFETILPTTLEHTDVLHVPLAGFPARFIVLGRGVVWQGREFPIIQNSHWVFQRGSLWAIRNWQRVAGKDYRLFEPQQLASTLAWPSSRAFGHEWNCPEAGLTMGACWSRYGMAYGGEALPDADAIQLEGVIHGLAGEGATAKLGPPRFIITHPTARAAATVEDGRIRLLGMLTGDPTGVSPVGRISVDGEPARNVVPSDDWSDLRRTSTKTTTEGTHTIRTWRVTTAGVMIPGSEMVFQYVVGAAVVTDPPPPLRRLRDGGRSPR